MTEVELKEEQKSNLYQELSKIEVEHVNNQKQTLGDLFSYFENPSNSSNNNEIQRKSLMFFTRHFG